MDSKSWRKSTYSGSTAGNCVELGQMPGLVLVRDTTDREGVTLPVSPSEWRAFASRIKGGQLPV
jgi:Domain of unknown function (DUF397)